MNNEMRRACVIPSVNDGKPFEALEAYFYRCRQPWFELVVVGGNVGTEHVFHTENEMDTAIALLHFQLAQALNPPIKVTQAVLDAMEKVPEARFWVSGINECGVHTTYPCLYSSIRGVWTVYDKVPKSLKIGDYIQADCPLALQVLLQFNEEGEKHA